MNIETNFQSARYQNLDNDPRGPYFLSDLTTSIDRPSLRYEWHGTLPAQGRSWRFSKQQAEALEREGRIVFSSSGHPQLKRYLAEARGELLDLLRSLPDTSSEGEVEFTRDVVPHLARVLDYAENQTFYEYRKDRYRADVVLSSSIESMPWLVLELKKTKPRNVGDWVYQLRRYLDAFHCRTGAVVSPEVFILVSDKGEKRFELRSLTPEQAEEILLALERGAQPPSPQDKELAHLALVDLLESVEKATTNDEKGKSLENLAGFLFNRVSSLRCKYRNLRTRSSEIDLVIEYDPSRGTIPLFEELGRYCLVECKNWSKPVGVGPVRDFMGKLDKCRTKLGIIFSKNGVTGVDAGADALREIQSRFDRDGVFLLVFSLEDLRGVADGNAFTDALDRKADGLRFDIQQF